jgi:Putative transposase
VLRILHGAIHTHLIREANIQRAEAASGAVTLIQRFGSAANLNTHLHALVLDGVYQSSGGDGTPVFMDAPAPNNAQLQALLDTIVTKY